MLRRSLLFPAIAKVDIFSGRARTIDFERVVARLPGGAPGNIMVRPLEPTSPEV